MEIERAASDSTIEAGGYGGLARDLRGHKDRLLTLAYSLVHDMSTAEDILHDVFVSFAGPDEAAALAEEAERLTGALAELPAEQREVVTLRLNGGLRFKEIARLQETSAPTVQARYRYGIEKLRGYYRRRFGRTARRRAGSVEWPGGLRNDDGQQRSL